MCVRAVSGILIVALREIAMWKIFSREDLMEEIQRDRIIEELGLLYFRTIDINKSEINSLKRHAISGI